VWQFSKDDSQQSKEISVEQLCICFNPSTTLVHTASAVVYCVTGAFLMHVDATVRLLLQCACVTTAVFSAVCYRYLSYVVYCVLVL